MNENIHKKENGLYYVCMSTSSPLKPLSRFHVEPPWDGGTKVFSNGLGQITKTAAMPVYCTNLNQMADDLETWYAALGTRILPSLFK